MYKRKYMLGIVMFCAIFLMAMIPAETLKSGQDLNLTFSCEKINCSDGDIYFTLINQDFQKVVDHENTTKQNGYFFYPVNLTGGSYTYFLSSDTDYYSSSFEVTESGVETTEGRSFLIIGLLTLLIFLLFISLYALFNVDQYIGKFALYWTSHVLMIIISFVAWQIGVEGLLGGLALTGVFRIMFWILTIAVLPMIILSGAWIFYIHTFNEHFEKLIEKGGNTEDAFRMANRKTKGWFGGR